jgi:transcription initiation factor TFIID subunit 3
MALQRAGALLTEPVEEEQEYQGEEDTRGVEAFVAWAMGSLNREITRIALDGEDEAGDYLDGELCSLSLGWWCWCVCGVVLMMIFAALKKKHSKNDDDSKYLGTLLGRTIEHGDVLVEGGECPSILIWEERRKIAGQKTPEPLSRPLGFNGDGDHDGEDGDGDGEGSRPPSSGLSSLGDRSIADEMDLS